MYLSKFNFRTIHCKFKGYQYENMNFSSQQYRAWSDSMDVHAGLSPNWGQSPLLSGVNAQFIFT